MAKKEAKPTVTLERVYNVPLRKGFLKVARHKRAKKAATTLREFLAKHMKSDNIKIGKYLNLELWKRGIKNPPHHVKVEAKKDSEGKVMAEIVGAPKEKKTEKKKGAEGIKKELSKLEAKTKEAAAKKAPADTPSNEVAGASKAELSEEKPAKKEKPAPKEPAKETK